MQLTRIALAASILWLPVAAGTFSGCKSAQSTTDSAAGIQKLVGDWNLTTLNGAEIASIIPKGVRVPSLSFTGDGKVSGTGGINRLASSLDLDALAKGEFKLAPVASTKMAGSPEAMAFEDSFFKALGQATTVDLHADALSLSNSSGQLMQLVRAD